MCAVHSPPPPSSFSLLFSAPSLSSGTRAWMSFLVENFWQLQLSGRLVQAICQPELITLYNIYTRVLYMSSSFWLLGVKSSDFSHAEKERIACKAEQVHKLTTIFTRNGPRLSFWVKIVVILWFAQLCRQFFLSFSAWEKSRDSTPNRQKLEDM